MNYILTNEDYNKLTAYTRSIIKYRPSEIVDIIKNVSVDYWLLTVFQMFQLIIG